MVDDNVRSDGAPLNEAHAGAAHAGADDAGSGPMVTTPVPASDEVDAETGVIEKNSPQTARAQQVAAADASGRTTISDIAVAKVAGIAARRVEGVFALGSGTSRALGALRDAVGSSDLAQGVHVEVGETQVAVDVNLVAAYGNPLQDVANQVRAAVYTAVQDLVGLSVIEVNVEINDVNVPGVNDPKGQAGEK